MSAYTEDKAHGFSQPDFLRLLNRQLHFLNARLLEIFQSIYCSSQAVASLVKKHALLLT